MNYRHIYHAGNFADVVKHALVTLAVEHLLQKDAPFRVIDTHAGIGVYDLTREEAQKTGEWQNGIGRVLQAKLPADVASILKPYLDVVIGENGGTKTITRYPGSPLIVRRLMRATDALVVNEAHPDDCASLRGLFARDKQTKVLELDGWTALKSTLPPKERRGLVLIDPPFEEPGEFQRMLAGLTEAARRFATGTVVLWYPIKDIRAVERFRREAAGLGIPKLYAAELTIRAPRTTAELSGTGLLVLNPPFTLPDKLGVLFPWLAKTLAQGSGGGWQTTWLTGERKAPANK